jgi:Protein of unknown function (DUF2846)
MRTRNFLLLMVFGIVSSATLAAGEGTASLPGPASQTLARIYFYREVGSYLFPRWTSVSLNDDKVGDLGPGTYFYRDVQPGTYRVGVNSDVPYPDQYRTVTVSANTATFIKIYNVPGYGVTYNIGGGSASVYTPTVFGNLVADPLAARREMMGLKPSS